MSSKGRKTVEQDEFYPTPADAIDPMLVSPLLQLPGGTWIEPCAGTGSIIRAVKRIRSDVKFVVAEINTRFSEALNAVMGPKDEICLPFGDFVHMEWPYPKAAVMIFNPPFSLALDFVKIGFERAHWVVMLQRTNWLGSKGRGDFLRRYCPDNYSLPTRPSFRPDGQTDSIEYSWFVWPPGDRERRVGQLAILDPPGTAAQQSLF